MDLKKFKMETGMSCVTLGVIILSERARETFSRNIFSLFSRKTARKTFLRYLKKERVQRPIQIGTFEHVLFSVPTS